MPRIHQEGRPWQRQVVYDARRYSAVRITLCRIGVECARQDTVITRQVSLCLYLYRVSTERTKDRSRVFSAYLRETLRQQTDDELVRLETGMEKLKKPPQRWLDSKNTNGGGA